MSKYISVLINHFIAIHQCIQKKQILMMDLRRQVVQKNKAHSRVLTEEKLLTTPRAYKVDD
jgi:hypothetical protein